MTEPNANVHPDQPLAWTPQPGSCGRARATGELLGETKAASDSLIGDLAQAVRDVREHEHPKWEDLYCQNLLWWLGERMAPVLRRLLDCEAKSERLRAQLGEAVATVARMEQARVEREKVENALRAQVAELEAENSALQQDKEFLFSVAERKRKRLVAAEADLLNIRGTLSPSGRPRRVPMALGGRVAPAVEWLADRVAELEAVAASVTEYQVRSADGLQLVVRRDPTGRDAWLVWEATRTPDGRRVWTRDGWRLLAELSLEKRFCWPDANTALAEARRIVGGTNAEIAAVLDRHINVAPICGSQCPEHEHVCLRSPEHQAGICRDRKQKGTESCTWDPVRKGVIR